MSLQDIIHKYFNAHMKARVRQFHVELKSIMKGNCSVTEFLLRVKAIANSLLAVGDVLSKKDQVDLILDGLPKEYNSFVMQMYGMAEPPTLYDVKTLLYIQELQLEKFKKDLLGQLLLQI